MLGRINTTGAMPGTERMMMDSDLERKQRDMWGRKIRELDADDARKRAIRDSVAATNREMHERDEADGLARAIANGRATTTCVTCAKALAALGAYHQYHRVPWHGMQPTGGALCYACWAAEQAQSPLNTPHAKKKAVASRARIAAERAEARWQEQREWEQQWQRERARQAQERAAQRARRLAATTAE